MRPPSAKAKAAVRAMLSHIDSDPLQLSYQNTAHMYTGLGAMFIIRMTYRNDVQGGDSGPRALINSSIALTLILGKNVSYAESVFREEKACQSVSRATS